MRLVHVKVPHEQRDAVLGALDDESVQYEILRTDGDGALVEFPFPTDAMGHIYRKLYDAGLPSDAYLVVTTAETATTGTIDELEARYASDYDPLSARELRSKSRDLSRDTLSFLALVVTSAVIAAAGLLLDSPAIVVGSMVIAPLVGPVLTASVGAVTGDRPMLVDSIELQILGLAAAVTGATAFSAAVRWFALVPPDISITAIELVGGRIAPDFLAVVVGIASGAAAAFGVTTKGPTSLIGVMIAAALIPAAATVGIALVWRRPLVALGALVLLLVSIVAINVTSFVTLRALGYRPDGVGSSPSASLSRKRAAALGAGALVLLALVGGVVVATTNQALLQRTVDDEVRTVLDDSQYSSLELAGVSVGYRSVLVPVESGPVPVTVTVHRPADRAYPDLADRLQRQVDGATADRLSVTVHYEEYQYPSASPSARQLPVNELRRPVVESSRPVGPRPAPDRR